ncbi:metal-dependent hydrolase [Mucilaginibacter sp. HMF5004]|uniref:metal-dependent hydrolase n=1 Tax=Mucilaginibacter rivuli TaxID=2857527 RepID=UPI001C5E7BD6|nr:metal-dependent hydrolase [Mucilaginibacter rivuli]MBW4888134.1 metal-dependent hydrolase [Mucilaginibacter rivuli]
MKFTFYGHSTFELEIDGTKLLFDPFITPNELAKHIDVNSLKPDYILLSHGHGDHVADLFAIQKNSGAKVICIADISHWLGKQGISNTHPMNIGGGYDFDFGRVKMVYALHSSSMPDGSYGGNPAGFVIYAQGKKIYFAGDTALTYDMKLLADEKLDWAILPIGDNYTMGIDDAIKTTDFIACKKVIGVHYDTFPVIKIDQAEARSKFGKAGIDLHLPAIGESMEL